MNAIALAARKLTDFLLLIAAFEIEGADIGAARHGALAELENVEPAGDFLPHRLLGIERVARLIDIAHPDRRPDTQRSGIRLFPAGQQTEQRRLAGAVGTDDANDTSRRKREVDVLVEQPITIGLGEAFGLDDHRAQPLRHRNNDLRRTATLFLGLGEQFLVGADTRLGFGLAGLWRLLDPFALARD